MTSIPPERDDMQRMVEHVERERAKLMTDEVAAQCDETFADIDANSGNEQIRQQVEHDRAAADESDNDEDDPNVTGFDVVRRATEGR